MEAVGPEGIAVGWAPRQGTVVSAALVRDDVGSNSQYLMINWTSSEVYDVDVPEASYGPMQTSLILVYNGSAGAEYQMKFWRLPSTSTTGQFQSGTWRYGAAVDDFCSTVEYLPTEGSSPYFRSSCGNGIVDSGEECDQGFGAIGCSHCQCETGYSCYSDSIEELPRILSASSIILYGLERIPSVSSVRGIAVREDLPALAPAVNGVHSVPDAIRFQGFSFCSLRPGPGCVFQKFAGAPFWDTSGEPSIALFVNLANGSALYESFSETGGNFIRTLAPSSAPLFPGVRSRFSGSSAVGCNQQVNYFVTWEDSAFTLTIRALNITTGMAAGGISSFSLPYYGSDPNTQIALNTTSREVFLFVYDSLNASESAVVRLTPQLALIEETRPWQPFSSADDIPNGVVYIPDYDAFGFSLDGTSYASEKKFAGWSAFRLGWPAKFVNTTTRVMKVAYPGTDSFRNVQWTLGNNFCCRQQCYNGACDSNTGECECKPGFSGSSCENYDLPVPANGANFAVIFSKMNLTDAELSSVTGCAHPSNGSSLIQLKMSNSTSPSFSSTSPFASSSLSAVLPAISLSSLNSTSATISGLFCRVTNTPSAAAGGDPKYAPLFTLVQVVSLQTNLPFNRTNSGDARDFDQSRPSDPIIYHATRGAVVGAHSVSAEVSPGGMCIGSIVLVPKGSPIPAIPLPSGSQNCSDASRLDLGSACDSKRIVNATWDSFSQDVYIFLQCAAASQTSIALRVAPAQDTNCSSALAATPGVRAVHTQAGCTYELTANATVNGDLYLAANAVVDLRSFRLAVRGNLYLAGIIATVWYARVSMVKRDASNLTLATTGSIGWISVDGVANLGGATVNVAIDASSLPPGSTTSSPQSTDVAVYPITFDSSSGSVQTQQTTITNENDPCLDYRLKSNAAETRPKGFQVLFSFDSVPTDCRASGPSTGSVQGNEPISVGAIAGIVVGIIAFLLLLGVIVYLLSPAFRAKTTPYRSTTV